jgi:hypothetical protein
LETQVNSNRQSLSNLNEELLQLPDVYHIKQEPQITLLNLVTSTNNNLSSPMRQMLTNDSPAINKTNNNNFMTNYLYQTRNLSPVYNSNNSSTVQHSQMNPQQLNQLKDDSHLILRDALITDEMLNSPLSSKDPLFCNADMFNEVLMDSFNTI